VIDYVAVTCSLPCILNIHVASTQTKNVQQLTGTIQNIQQACYNMRLSALILFYCAHRYKTNAVSVFGLSHWLTKPFLSAINSRRSDSANTTTASLNSVTNLDWT